MKITAPEDDIRDEVRLAHDIRQMLWEDWGARAAPELWIADGESGVRARGTDDVEYIVTIRKKDA